MSKFTQEDFKYMALAGGYEILFSQDKVMLDGSKNVDRNSGLIINMPWNPDTDLADCFRLAIDAGIDIEYMAGRVFAMKDMWDGKPRIVVRENIIKAHNNDKHAATMKAVCDCAIEIGKTMGGKDEYR